MSKATGSGQRSSATAAPFQTAKFAARIAMRPTIIQKTQRIISPGAGWRSGRAGSGIEAVAQLLARLEEGDELLVDRNAVAGPRVPPDTGIAPLDREGAEAAQL